MSREHEQYEQNVAAYLLGALTELEAEVFEKHLTSCGACRHDFERLRLATDALPRAVDPIAPSPALKESIMATVWEESAAAEREAGEHRRARRPRFLPWLLELRPAVAAGAATLLLAVGVLGGWGISQLGGGGGGGESTITAQVDHSRIPRGSGSFVVASDKSHGVLRVNGMPPPPPGHVYEVWLQRGSQVIPSSLFSVSSEGTGAAAVPESLSGVKAVMVTRERATGARAPSEKPIIQVKLT